MNKVFTLSLLFFMLSAQAQDYAAHLIPEDLLENANEVIREESSRYIVKSESEGRLIFKQVVTILSPKSKANLLYLPYDKDSKIESMTGTVYDQNGQLVRKIAKREIRDFSFVSDFSIYEDDRIKLIEVAYSQYPFTIEWTYEKKIKGIAFCLFPDWNIQGFGTSVQESEYVIETPSGFNYVHQKINVDIEPEVSTLKGNAIAKWRIGNLPAIISEPYMGESFRYLPKVIFSPSQFTLADYEGGMASWEDYGAFIHQFYVEKQALPEDLKQKVHEMTQGADSDKEKIQILYRFLQAQMRYVSVQLGVGGWEPFDVDYVWTNKYGDCKALANFMVAVLKEIDIQAYPAIIYNGDPVYNITQEFTNPSFNHVIVYVPGVDYWLECTSSTLPVNYIGSSNSDRFALLITKKGGQLKRTPQLNEELNHADHHLTVTLRENGSANIQGVATFKGERHEIIRSVEKQLSKEDQKKWMQNQTSLPSMTLNNLDFSSSSELPQANYKIDLDVYKYASKGGKRLFVPIHSITDWKKMPKSDDNRIHPIVLKDNYAITDTIVIQFPEGYELENLPNPQFQKEAPFASYDLQFQEAPGRLTVTRKMVLRPATLEPGQYSELRGFYAEVAKAEAAKFVLVQR